MSDEHGPIPPGRLKGYRVFHLVYNVLVVALFGFALTRTSQSTASEVWWLLIAGATLSAVVAVWTTYALLFNKPLKWWGP
jgi:hypothetical protein